LLLPFCFLLLILLLLILKGATAFGHFDTKTNLFTCAVYLQQQQQFQEGDGDRVKEREGHTDGERER